MDEKLVEDIYGTLCGLYIPQAMVPAGKPLSKMKSRPMGGSRLPINPLARERPGSLVQRELSCEQHD